MIRAGLIFLAIVQGAAGLVQLFAPATFYDDFPGVALLPPYNEHLMRDVGALTCAYVLGLTAAAIWMERRLVQVALAVNLVWTVPHFVFHAMHLEHFTAGGATFQTIALALAVLIPAALLFMARRLPAG